MTNPLLDHFRMLAQYNKLANATLYAACARLTDEEYHKTRPAFFRSIHGTLNHLLVGDRIWMGRFEGPPMPSTPLAAVLHATLADLQSARVTEDTRIDVFAQRLEMALVAGHMTYTNNAGMRCRDPVTLLLAHFFNHQTHHRGQVHDMLSQTAVPPPSLDMHRLIGPEPV